MSLLRRSRLLVESCSRLGQSTASPWRRPCCSLYINNQKRGNQNHYATSRRKHYKPEIVQEQGSRRKYEYQNTAENQSQPEEEYQEYFNPPKVRRLRPAIATLLLSSGFYAFFSYRQAKEELKPRSWSISNPVSNWSTQPRAPPTPTEVVTNAWGMLDPVSKMTWGLIGVNSAVHLSKFVVPGPWFRLWHVPARNVNYSLLTSAFVHSGAVHFGFNMVGLSTFLPTVGYSPQFQGNNNHIMSFYLSTAVVASLAQHVAATVFKHGHNMHILIPSGGASGALFAVLGSYCVQYPSHQLGIMFLPFRFDAQYFLAALMLFDFVGMVRGYSFSNLGHGAHFGGAVAGIAYTALNGRDNIWRPSVEFWKRRLQNKA